jgi:Flp pilus assembly protein TadG
LISSAKNSEKGQAIVYLTLGMIVFFGFIALAIDGGMALADRRHLQNIADAASLAGGGRAALDIEKWNFTTANWNCGEVQFAMNNAEYAAIQRAEANKFTITDTVGAKHNFVEATCNNASKYIDITVEISGTTASNFLQLVFPEALHNVLEAVTRIYPGGPLGGNHAIIALNPDQNCGPKTDFGANGDFKLILNGGGGIFSNGCIYAKGSGSIVVNDGGVVQGFKLDDKFGLIDPPPQYATQPIDPSMYAITPPNCDDPRAHHITNGVLPDPMPAGLYCVSGGLKLVGNKTYTGAGVTIVILTGDVDMAGTITLNLSAPSTDKNAPDPSPAIPGLLFYVPYLPPSPNCPSDVTINGTSDTFFIGTILAPCSDLHWLGTNKTGTNVQVIGWNVEIGGTADFINDYNAELLASLPASMELYK